MNCIFKLPHIFIVFQPGTGGNFIAGLLSKLINCDSSELPVSKNGSSHTTIGNKVAGTDYMSFGTTFDEQTQFDSDENRLSYYLGHIETLNSTITTPQVIWSHDFTNIPLYQKFFPNSKILVITQNSNVEKLVAICMNVTKNWMDPNHTPPFPTEQWKVTVAKTDSMLELGLKSLVGEQKSKDIVKNKFDDANHNIIKFIRLRQMFGYFRLLHLVDTSLQPTADVANNVLFRTPWEEFIKNLDFSKIYKVGPTYDLYINEQCIQLPFGYLIEDQLNLLINAIESLLGHLTETQQIFVTKQFNSYRNMQDQTMLTDPYKYFSELRSIVANN